MKKGNMLFAAAGILVSCLLLYTCQKGFSGLSQAKPSITASSTNVAVGQTVSLSILNAPMGTHNVWASTPVASTKFSTALGNNAANVLFSKPGTYIITCYFADGIGADSLPVFDTTLLPHDTTAYYPPRYDTLYTPHDTITNNPHDTIPSPTDSSYNNGDTSRHPIDTTHYPVDTTHYPPADSTHYPADSTGSTYSHTGVNSARIVIVVH